MYRKGELKVTVPPCAGMLAERDGYCYTDEHAHLMYDARGSKENPVGTAYLPHSCDEWVIGGKEEVQTLIDDLLEILATMP